MKRERESFTVSINIERECIYVYTSVIRMLVTLIHFSFRMGKKKEYQLENGGEAEDKTRPKLLRLNKRNATDLVETLS